MPPATRSNKGPGEAADAHALNMGDNASESRRRNLEKQGRQGNIKVNTTNQGYQQDR